jgi:hypothetical protein
MCDMVTLGGKENVLEPRDRTSTVMSSALDLKHFNLKTNREDLPPMGSRYV